MKTTILERIYKRLLSESETPNVEGYGAHVDNVSHNSIVTVIYNVPTLEGALHVKFSDENKGGAMDVKDAAALIAPSIVGYVGIMKPVEACCDAYEITHAAGPGKIVYGCAYATSPSGLVISSRESMTPAAKRAWRGMAAKGTRGRKKLDNVYDPVTPEPEDDCFLRDEDDLDYAYERKGGEEKMLKDMVAQHEALKSRLIKEGGAIAEFVVSDLQFALREAGLKFFDKKYGPYGG